MNRANKNAIQYEKTTWLKILGLPLRLWDEANFSLIVGRFGRVVSPFNVVSNRRDSLMGKIGVLTSQRK